MAFAMPLAARARSPRSLLLVRLVPGLLLGAGALLLAQPWRTPAAPITAGTVASATDPLATTTIDPAAIVGALLVVGGLLFFLPSIVQRLSPHARGKGAIAIVESRPLGGRKSLLLVEVSGRRLLLGVSEQGLTTLAELDSGRFAGALAQELAASATIPSAPPSAGNPG